MTKNNEKTEKTKETDFKLNIEEMAQAGVQFGHKVSNCHPKMKPYIQGVKNGVHLIDLEKTREKFIEALSFAQDTASKDGIIVFVGTKVQAKNLIKQTAESLGMPYVSERWLGGTLTNFETIRKRINYFKELERKKAAGELEKYTKKERAKFDKELAGLEKNYAGIKMMDKLPSAIFIVDMKKEDSAVREAKIRKLKIIAMTDTNIDPTFADYPIPANDDAVTSISYILGKVAKVIREAKPASKE